MRFLMPLFLLSACGESSPRLEADAALPSDAAMQTLSCLGREVSAARPHLVYLTQSAGYRHEVLPRSVEVLSAVSAGENLELTHSEDIHALLAPGALEGCAALVFYTSGELPVDAEEKNRLLDFVRRGGGFAGIHSASDTLYTWPEYGQLLGARFNGHPWTQPVRIERVDVDHPAQGLAEASRIWTDEIYQFRDFIAEGRTLLLRLDPSSVDLAAPGVVQESWSFPLAWASAYGQGRVFYSALGHGAIWEDEGFQQHLRRALRWVAGL